MAQAVQHRRHLVPDFLHRLMLIHEQAMEEQHSQTVQITGMMERAINSGTRIRKHLLLGPLQECPGCSRDRFSDSADDKSAFRFFHSSRPETHSRACVTWQPENEMKHIVLEKSANEAVSEKPSAGPCKRVPYHPEHVQVSEEGSCTKSPGPSATGS